MSDLYNHRQPSYVGQGQTPSRNDDYVDAYPSKQQQAVNNSSPPRQQGRQGHGYPGRQAKEPTTNTE